MKKSLKLAFMVAGIAIASIGYITKANATTAALKGECVGSGYCGTTSQGTDLAGKWHENDSE